MFMDDADGVWMTSKLDYGRIDYPGVCKWDLHRQNVSLLAHGSGFLDYPIHDEAWFP
jgi:hypothetical protein